MNLDFVRGESQEYSKLTSTNARNYAFAGIAIVWVLSNESSGEALNYLSLWIFALALLLDLLQYAVGTLIWAVFDSCQQKKLKKKFGHEENAHKKIEGADFEAPWYINWPTMTFFIAKTSSVIVGYIALLWAVIAQ